MSQTKYKVESQFKHDGAYITLASNLTLGQAMTRMKQQNNKKNHKNWQDPFYIVKKMGES